MDCDQLLARPNQKLIDHLKEIKNKIPSNYVSEFDSISFLLHDIGKISDEFQKKLKEKKDTKFRHPLASLPIIEYILKEYQRENQNAGSNDIDIYLMLIYYHHSRISFDMLQKDLIDLSMQKESINIIKKDELKRVKCILRNLNPNHEKYFDEKKFVENYLKADESNYNQRYKEKIREILTRIYNRFRSVSPETKKNFSSLYSLFVELDWYSSSEGTKEEILPNWNDMTLIFEKKFNERKEKIEKDAEVEKIRNKVYDLMIKNINESRIFLCAPTGIGKTELSLKWALENAKNSRARRIIYVLPYRNLINDLYGRFTFYFGEQNVDKWDSDWITDKTISDASELSDFEEFNFYITARKYFMDKPIIITTADQILMSFLNLERYPIRYGLLMNSVIVFDEIQAYGIDMRNLLYNLIGEIATIKSVDGKDSCRLAITTATPPFEISISNVSDSLNIGNVLFKVLYDKNWWSFHRKRDAEIIIKEADKSEILDLIEEKLEKDEKYSRICMIVNTISDAVDLYTSIKKDRKLNDLMSSKGYEIGLLHSSLIYEHKEEELRKIKSSKKAIAISTQVLEAGVDISFDCVIRLVAPIPSLVQSAGRVNRDGKSNNAEFVILVPKSKSKSNNQESSDKKSKINFYGPYDKEEVNKVLEMLREIREGQLKKSEFSEEFIKKEVDSLKFDYIQSKEYIDFVNSFVSSNIWSVSTLDPILPEGFRYALGKVEVFVEEKSYEKEEMEKKLQEYVQKIKEDKETYSKYIKEYLQTLKMYQNRFILTYESISEDIPHTKTIDIDKYNKLFYPK